MIFGSTSTANVNIIVAGDLQALFGRFVINDSGDWIIRFYCPIELVINFTLSYWPFCTSYMSIGVFKFRISFVFLDSLFALNHPRSANEIGH